MILIVTIKMRKRLIKREVEKGFKRKNKFGGNGTIYEGSTPHYAL